MKYNNLTESVLSYLNTTSKSTLTEATNNSLPLGEISFVKKQGGYINVKLEPKDIKAIEKIFDKHVAIRFTEVEIIVDPKAVYNVIGFSAVVDDKFNPAVLSKMIGGGTNLKSVRYELDFGYVDNKFWIETSLDDDYDLNVFKRVIKRKSLEIYEDIKYLIYGLDYVKDQLK